MTSQQELHDFLALNPDFDQERRDPETSVREWEELRSLGRRVFFDQLDENDGHPDQSRADIARRAELARQQAEACEDRRDELEEGFVRLNPQFGVLPDRTLADQHRYMQGRERTLVLGGRVAAAEARENNGSPGLAAALVRFRAEQASQRARDPRPTERTPLARTRTGAER